MNLTNAKYLIINGQNVVRLIMGENVIWKGLPQGYTRLDYIEATGTQYIDTGFNPNQDTRIICEFMPMGVRDLYGSRTSTSANNFALRRISSCFQHCYGTSLLTTTIEADSNWHIIDQNKNLIFVDGAEGLNANGERIEYTGTEFTPNKSITLGAIKAGSMYYGQGRYRSCKIYDNGILVRDFIPCLDKNNKVGMYDTVNAQFYESAGTDEFIAGY